MAKINFNWTTEKKDQVIYIIEKWIIKYKAYSGEKVYQDDDCIANSPELISDILDDIIKLPEEEVEKLFY